VELLTGIAEGASSMLARFCSARVRWCLAGGSLLGLVLIGVLGYRAWSTRQEDYWLQKGRTALGSHRWHQADDCARALEQHGWTNATHLLRGLVLVTRARATPELNNAETQPGSLSASSGRGLALVDAAAEPAPVSAPGKRLRPRVREQYEQAIEELTQVADAGPEAREAALLVAECLARLDQKKMAAELLETVVRQEPDRLAAHKWLAAIYIDLSCPQQAATHLSDWARLDPANGRPCRWLGFFYKDNSRPEQAVQAYREALQRGLGPAMQADVVREWARVLITANADYQAALDVLARCPPALESDSEFAVERAECLLGLGQTAEAKDILDRVLADKAVHPSARALRAQIYMTEDDPRAALPLLRQAIHEDAYNVKTRGLLALACQQTGDTVGADEQQRRVAELKATQARMAKLVAKANAQPWDDECRCELAEFCLRRNRTDEARMWLRAALSSNPGSERARTILKRLPLVADRRNP